MAGIGAMGRAISWMARHPTATMAAAGGTAGFVGSGFSGWGAIAGAGLGAIGGNAGWKYKSPNKLIRSAGKKIATYSPELSLRMRIGSEAMKDAGQMDKAFGELGLFGRQWERSHVIAPSMRARGFRIATQQGGLMISKMGARTLATAGVGLGAGVAVGIGSHVLGSNFDSGRKTRYGAVFSGMGNGPYGGYR